MLRQSEEIWIGSPFERSVTSTVPSPVMKLFNPVTREYFTGDIQPSNGNDYIVTWSAEDTAKMVPGRYILEVYTQSGYPVGRVTDYAIAVIVSDTPTE